MEGNLTRLMLLGQVKTDPLKFQVFLETVVLVRIRILNLTSENKFGKFSGAVVVPLAEIPLG